MQPRDSFSHYALLEKLGEGGMGSVYKAQDLRLERLVALKFLLPGLLNSAEARARFLREGRALSSLNHPNIATVFEVDEVGGEPFLALEYLQGGTLRHRIRTASAAGRQIAFPDIVEWAIAMADGLSHSHRRGIIHRDVKSSNAMFDGEGRLKLTDFGLAKITGNPEQTCGIVAGTFGYMAPEQASGGEVDTRSDLYSLGVVIYEMATGQLPFPGKSPAEVIQKIMNAHPPRASQLRVGLPEDFDETLAKLLAKAPDQRYQRGEHLVKDLAALRPAATGSQASTVTQLPPWKVTKTRRKWLAASGGLALVGTIAYTETEQLRRWLLSGGLPKQKHLAVLPFRSIGGDASQQAFCDGLTEILTTALTREGELSVVPSTDSRRLESVEQARREFGVNLVIYGSVQRRGDDVRLIIGLVDAETKRQIAAQPVEWPVVRIMELEDDVLVRVADMMNLVLSHQPQVVLAAGASQASGAQEAYLRGRGFLYRYDKAGNLDRAQQQFEEAIRLDPKFAAAYVGLAEARLTVYRARREPGTRLEPIELQSARMAAERAVELNPRLANAHMVLGAVLAGSNQPDLAVGELETALKLDSLDPAAYRELARLYSSQRKYREAEQTYQRAIAARPGDWQSYSRLAVLYFSQHQYADAERLFKRAIELSPDNPIEYRTLGVTLVRLGRNREAEKMLRKSLALGPSAISYLNLGALLMFESRYAEAVQVMEQAARLAPTESPNNYLLWGNLGDAYWLAKAGPAKSRAAWRQAEQIGERQLTGTPDDAELLGYIAKYHAKLGDKAQSTERAKNALNLGPASATVHYQVSLAYAILGENERALAELAAAIEHGYSISEIRESPELAIIRSDPRFNGIIKSGGRR